MDDGITDSESLINPLNLSPRAGWKDGDGGERNRFSEIKEEEKGGGIISHLISNLVSPKAGEVRGDNRVEAFEVGENGGGFELDEEEKGDDGKGGKIISNLISTLFHKGETEKEFSNEDNRAKDVEEDEQAKTQVDGGGDGGGGGIIENIVSHLPSPFSDNAAPTTDEASILIHSIIHD